MKKLIVFLATFFSLNHISAISFLLEDSVQCSMLSTMVSSSSEQQINLTSNASICFPNNNLLQYDWTVSNMSGQVIGDGVGPSFTADLGSPSLDSIVVCLGVNDFNEVDCLVCDTLFYNGPIYEWISINSPDIAYQIVCDNVEVFIASSSQYQIQMGSNILEMDGLLTYYWTISTTNGDILSNTNTLQFNQIQSDTLISCLTSLDQYSENCEICEELIWNGNDWVIYQLAEEPILSIQSVTHTDTAAYGESFNVYFTLVNNDTDDFVDDIIINFKSFSEEQNFESDSASLMVNINAEIASGASIPVTLNIPVTQQNFQYAGDNLVVIWPSSVAPIPTDTSITSIYIKDLSDIISFEPQKGGEENDESYVDLLGKKYSCWSDILKGTVYLKKGRKYLKF